MATVEVFFTLFYILFSVCLIFPPNEFVSAGITVQNIFRKWIGSEDLHFIHHHVKRTSATVLVHSFIPFGYLCGLLYIDPQYFIDGLYETNAIWRLYCFISVLLPILGTYLTYTWSRHDWRNHPICHTLSLHAANGSRSSWRLTASDINVEFRRIDKICIHTSSISKVVATDNWIMKVMMYDVKIALQSDVALLLVSSDQHDVSVDSPGRTQYLNIEVKSVREGVKPFNIRVNSFDMKDLQDKCHRPIVNIQNISIHQSLSDRFLVAFREQVAENNRVTTREELESCIGCMQNPANVKLVRSCGTQDQPQECASCYCRPMWCIDCMGKWFASRQDQEHPETWLGSKCPCPTCRSKFCVLDVCFLEEM